MLTVEFVEQEEGGWYWFDSDGFENGPFEDEHTAVFNFQVHMEDLMYPMSVFVDAMDSATFVYWREGEGGDKEEGK